MGICYHPSVLKSERCVPLQSAEDEASFVCQCCKAMSNSEQAARHFRKQPTQNAENFKLEATMQTISTESSVCTDHMAIRMGSYVHTRKQRSNRCFRTHKHSNTAIQSLVFSRSAITQLLYRAIQSLFHNHDCSCMHAHFFSYRVHSLSAEKILARSSFATWQQDLGKYFLSKVIGCCKYPMYSFSRFAFELKLAFPLHSKIYQ